MRNTILQKSKSAERPPHIPTHSKKRIGDPRFPKKNTRSERLEFSKQCSIRKNFGFQPFDSDPE
ncbi:hypothetical protein CH380_03290 [Leptospira adleri]|uniref:Uncharacterized protein n=1 Tax=Leptospira adleri TaxID=2023186 RepID=A0A2M9YT85_9LEPT|nr:hypothetical protein CH380_03290 [Leptospira adleri]PJZ60467.1 hypothetical protein CH376_18355 [Leptospira adleri]